MNFFIFDSIKWHLSSHWTESHNFPVVRQQRKDFLSEINRSIKILNSNKSYCLESIVKHIEIKCVPFGCHAGIIHNDVNMIVLLFNQRNERVNALFVRNIELFNVDLGVGVFCQDFVFSFVRKFDISASHDNVPILTFG